MPNLVSTLQHFYYDLLPACPCCSTAGGSDILLLVQQIKSCPIVSIWVDRNVNDVISSGKMPIGYMSCNCDPQYRDTKAIRHLVYKITTVFFFEFCDINHVPVLHCTTKTTSSVLCTPGENIASQIGACWRCVSLYKLVLKTHY